MDKKVLDYGLVIAYGLLALVSLLLIYTATYHSDSASFKALYQRQFFWYVLGCGVITMLYFTSFKYIYILVYFLYGISIFFLVFIIVFPHSDLVYERWLIWGHVRFQPAEFAKIATIFMLARYFANTKIDFTKIEHFIIPFILTALPGVLIAKQPDLGTSIVFLALLIPMFFWAGISYVTLLYLVFPIINVVCSFNWISWMIFMSIVLFFLFKEKPPFRTATLIFGINLFIGIVTPFLWNNLHEYQKSRIITFLNPENDPLGAGYQIIQSKVAVGSGGIFGKGYLQGTQIKLAFLPEQHTDFILSVLGEEFGFLGIVVVLGIFYFIIYRGIKIALLSHNRFASLTCIGIVSIIFFHVIVNAAMVVGFMPVTGLPLPFLSYGGSACLTFSFMIGMLLSIYARQWEY